MTRRMSDIQSQSLNIELLVRSNAAMSFRKSQITKPTINSFNIYKTESKPRSTAQVKQSSSDCSKYSQTDRRISVASTVKRFKKTLLSSQAPKRPITEIRQNYDILDLTFTLIESKMKIWISGFWFFLFLVIRVYALCCCIYISTNSVHIEWLIPFLLVRVMFFILVIKISLNDPTTRTQITLKTHWNSIQSGRKEYFEVTSLSKLFISILRGMTPAQLSFIYIRSQSMKKKYQIFTAINFIFISIEQIVFYPFFIIYCSYLVKTKTFSADIDVDFQYATISIVSFGFAVFIVLSIYLLILGVKKKYGGLRYWYHHKKHQWRWMEFYDKQDSTRSSVS